MSAIKKYFILMMALLLIAHGGLHKAFADHNDRKEKKRHQKRHRYYSEHDGKGNLAPVNNATYKENCGACHFPYQPGLLPAGSWDKILSGLDDHFGEMIELDPDSKKILAEYLKSNAAEHSSAKLSAKIMKCLGQDSPMRITEVPYIRKKHHEIRPVVFEREAIGSFSNCSACHKTAESGIYDDDYVSIPK